MITGELAEELFGLIEFRKAERRQQNYQYFRREATVFPNPILTQTMLNRMRSIMLIDIITCLFFNKNKRRGVTVKYRTGNRVYFMPRIDIAQDIVDIIMNNMPIDKLIVKNMKELLNQIYCVTINGEKYITYETYYSPSRNYLVIETRINWKYKHNNKQSIR